MLPLLSAVYAHVDACAHVLIAHLLADACHLCLALRVDFVSDTVTTVSAMKAASADLKKGMKDININEVEDLHDDMTDLLEDADEINEVTRTNTAHTHTMLQQSRRSWRQKKRRTGHSESGW